MASLGPEPELITSDTDGSRRPGEPPAPKRPRIAAGGVAVLVGGLIALFVVLSRSPDLATEPGVTQPKTGTSVLSATSNDIARSEPDVSATSDTTEAMARVDAVPDHSELEGPVALATFASGPNSGIVWVVDDHGVRARRDVPLWPGDWPFHILFAGGQLAFVSPPEAVLLDASLDREPEPLVAARYLLPGATPDVIWAIDQPMSTITEVAFPSGDIGRQYLLDPAITWVSGAIADGFVVMVDSDQRFWSPESGFEDLPAPAPGQSGFYLGRNNTAVLISPGPMASIVDLVEGAQLDVRFDIGQGLVTEVCLSPTMQYLAISGSTGEAVVIDLDQPATVVEFTTGQEFDSLGWTSPDQLVYIDERRYVVAIAVPSGDPALVARLHDTPGQRIGLTGSAAFC